MRIVTLLSLIRLPNVFTAVADVLAGFLYAGGMLGQWASLLGLCAASACLYAGGVALNDVCDAGKDRRERPERPIPAGKISRRAAAFISIGLLAAGFAAACVVSVRSAIVAGTVVVAVVFYDLAARTTFAGPAVMGMCRAMNLALGMSIAAFTISPRTAVPLGVMWLYITSVTAFSRGEAGLSRQPSLILALLGICAAVLGLVAVGMVASGAGASFYAAVMIVVGMVLSAGIGAVRDPSPAGVQRAVKIFILCLIGLDLCIAWSARGPLGGLIVGGVILPALAAARRIRVT